MWSNAAQKCVFLTCDVKYYPISLILIYLSIDFKNIMINKNILIVKIVNKYIFLNCLFDFFFRNQSIIPITN